MYICMYVRWLSTCSDMFQLENEIFVNGLAFRKRFHGDGNVSCFAKGWKLRAGGCVECDSVFGSRPSRLVRALFRSITHLCQTGFHAFVFRSKMVSPRAGKFE